jgi:hypothetical protein
VIGPAEMETLQNPDLYRVDLINSKSNDKFVSSSFWSPAREAHVNQNETSSIALSRVYACSLLEGTSFSGFAKAKIIGQGTIPTVKQLLSS